MQYENFIETIDEFEEDYELIELLYFGAIERLRDVQKDVSKLDDLKHIQRIMKLFLISWGMMNRVVGRKNLDWKKLGETLRSLEKEFALLRDKKFLNIDFNDETLSHAIKTIYGKLDPIPYLGSPTTISKILHLLNPEIFVMWDNAIVNFYHEIDPDVDYSASEYLEFLKLTQKTVIVTLSKFERETEKSLDNIEAELRRKYQNKTTTKLIDEYNWMKR
jgi:hypothetical protein